MSGYISFKEYLRRFTTDVNERRAYLARVMINDPALPIVAPDCTGQRGNRTTAQIQQLLKYLQRHLESQPQDLYIVVDFVTSFRANPTTKTGSANS